MKLSLRLAAALLAALLLTGCGAQNTPAPESTPAPDTEPTTAPTEPVPVLPAVPTSQGQTPDDNYRTWYEIFVYSFCDSNGDGIGDLPGVTSKLDYLEELGVTGIWLMPICPSPSYHKYDVKDYCAIDPDYGTMEDFTALLEACHARGIRVITDLVVNHSSIYHPWFQTAVQYLSTLEEGQMPDPEACPYVEYYHFVPAGEAGSGYKVLSSGAYAYECQFSEDMPDLNWDSQALREEVAQIMDFWLELGVDGFRLDAAKEFYSGQPGANTEVLAYLQETATAINPDAYLVAEVWSDQTTINTYYASGITSIFAYAYGDATGAVAKTVNQAGNDKFVYTFTEKLEASSAAILAANPNAIDAPFLSNHDVGRSYGFMGGDENKIKMAAALNLTMGGSAFIYYGEEIGMRGSGNDPSKRAPMYWNEARDNGTTQCPPDCTLPDSYKFGSLETQRYEESSIYTYYRRLCWLRKEFPLIARGVNTVETTLNGGCICALRKTGDDGSTLLLIYNIDTESAALDLTGTGAQDYSLSASLSADGGDITLEGNTLTLAPFGVAILEP